MMNLSCRMFDNLTVTVIAFNTTYLSGFPISMTVDLNCTQSVVNISLRYVAKVVTGF